MECGSCTLCCKLLELHDIPSAIGEYCSKCEIGVGCSIYDIRPKECQEFRCMWHQMEKAGEELRPDKCNVIFDRASEDVIVARLEENKKLNNLVLAQINSFINEGFSVLVFRGKEYKPYIKPGHTIEHLLGAVHDRS